MPPELVNRLDEIVVFRALERHHIEAIARAEIEAARVRIAGYYDMYVSGDVIAHIAHVGYDRMYGARHLHRNIEKLLLQPLADREPGTYAVSLDGLEIRIEALRSEVRATLR